MHELTINLHMHTTFSDGTGSHQDIANAALASGLDAVIVTDHNILVQGKEGYTKNGKKRVLLLVGEEIHNQARLPQKSHLLVIGAERELAPYAEDPQILIDNVRKSGGICFLAHPIEHAAPSIGETAIDWEDWHVHGYNGIELWNGLGEMKSIIPTKFHAIFYAFLPSLIAHGPYPEVLNKWDELLSTGKPIVAVAGSDAHALKIRLGPLKRTIFPYKFHFSAINTHIFVPQPLSGDLPQDKAMIYEALAKGHAFAGYDLPAATSGFRFTAQGKEHTALMGDEISAESGVTLQVRLPQRAECHLLKDGQVVQTWSQHETCAYITTQPGVYRVEVYRQYLGKRRGWIFSNPIYVR